jgi:Transposase DDE domain
LKLPAFSRLATDGAYLLRRLQHQTTLLTMAAGRWPPVALARGLTTAEGPLLERPIFLGAQARVASRLMASRVPEAIVNARRRKAQKQAQKTGATPSPAHLTLMAWNRFMTHVPHTRWQTATVVNVYPLRWHIERIVKSWKSYLH